MKKLLLFTLIVSVITPLSLFGATETKEVKPKLPETTFAIIKPDAVRTGNTGSIIDLIELNDFEIVGMEKKHLTKKDAETFYAVHKKRPFFKDLVEYMTSGPIVILALKKENAIKDWRTLMGATDPLKAEVGTIRKMFGTDITENATHGSDAPETAATELKLFFPNI